MKRLINKLSLLLILITVASCSKDNDTVIEPEPEAESEPTPVALLSSISPTSGPKTTIVTINGSNFGEDPSKVQVYFNEVEADVQLVNNNKIITTVPARAYTGMVKVVVNGAELEGPEFNYTISDVMVTTFVGTKFGNMDGEGTNARFKSPTDAVIDSQGNMFIVDRANHSIRKVTPEGSVSTFAGSTRGFSDGTGTNAQFDYPYGIAIDEQDNLYVTDTKNYKVRKITPSGVVSTLAGTDSGDVDGTGAVAKFMLLRGVIVDSKGNVFVADEGSHKIRKIQPDGLVSSFAGIGKGNLDGIGAYARFAHPHGLSIDKEDNIYVADAFNHKIRKVTPSREVTTIAGTTGGFLDGPVESAKFSTPIDIAVNHDGLIYIVGWSGHSVRKIGMDGIVSTIAGSNTRGAEDGTGATAQFLYPSGLCLGTEGTLYVVDTDNNRIRKITQE